MRTCADIMTANPLCHEPTAALDLVAKTMAEHDIGPVPIVDSMDSMKLVGIVTDRDRILVDHLIVCFIDGRHYSRAVVSSQESGAKGAACTDPFFDVAILISS